MIGTAVNLREIIFLLLGFALGAAFFLCVTVALAAEPEDKELQILQLQKIIAEQTLATLRRDIMVSEYERIRANYEKVLAEIAEKEKAKEKK